MADILIDYDVETLTVDQADYGEDGTLNVQIVNNSDLGTLIIKNSSDSPDALNLAVLGEEGSRYTTGIRLEDGANVKLVEFTAWEGDTSAARPTVFVENGSTLEFTPEFLSSGQVPFDIRVFGGGKLIYDSTGTNIDQSDPLIRLTVISPGSEIQVSGADSYSYVDSVLTFKNSEGEIVGNFSAPWIYDPMELEGDTLVFTCYLKGTHIATPDGEVKVETLKAGDKVLTASGGINIVKWLGFRKLNRNRIPDSHLLRASPIRICKGAFAENIPHRDLAVSPGHRFSFDGALVPALSLVNGITIIQDFNIQEFEYYHVELEKFDMLLAEGAAAESYLEVGSNRNSFQNARTVTAYPDFGPAHDRVFLPEYVQKITPDIIEPIRRDLFKRAEILTGAVRTADSDLRVEINGQVIKPQTRCRRKGIYRFELPAGLSGEISILSNAAVVRETSLIDRTDTRTLGVGLSRLALVIEGQHSEIDLNDASLTGFNKVQEMDGVPMRWTNGKAVIPASLIPTSFTSSVLELDVLRTHMYWDCAEKINIRRVA
ncbi:MAG: Hint domain-containing protein [Advenella sp.]